MKLILLAICMAFPALFSVAQTFRINEVMSSNGGAIIDIDGETSDWIEFFNSGATSVNLNGYGLSDKKDKPFKWIFPDLQINPGEYLMVFASGKDRREAPLFWNTVISQGDYWKYQTPVAEPASTWRNSGFDDSKWSTGKSGFGYGDNDDATVLSNSRVVFIRKTFIVNNLAAIKQLILHIDYDDGFVAYLNGKEIARAQMAGKGDYPAFNALSSGEHEALMYLGQMPEKFVVDNPTSILRTGENILAIQVHNVTTTSTDLSVIPFLSIGSTEEPIEPRIIELLKISKNELHTNFKIDAEGESLYLTNPSGVLADSVRVGALQVNYSFGRTSKDPAVWAVFDKSTPGKENSGEIVAGEKAGKPVFNLPGGVYSSELKVDLTAPNQNDTIFYTLDGSVPTRSSYVYSNGINIYTSKVIRARILKSGKLPGETVTNSYIIYPTGKLPFVSISMDPFDLWDYNSGIYVKGPNAQAETPFFGANFWMDWEKPCHFEMMETSGDKVIDVDAGVKIYGNYSRANDQKSMAFYCRKAYGSDMMKYKIFQERPFDEFKDIALRNSGNDWNNTMFRDGLMTGLTLGLNVDQQAFRPATIFLNGEYWGILNIREKINEHFIASNNNVDADDVTILENNGTPIVGTADDYWTMYNFLGSNSLASQANYNKMLEWIDVNSFIDYYASEIYFRNHDWPGNNIRYWKTNNSKGRWRWILFDTDFGMGIWYSSPEENTLELATANDPSILYWPNPPWSTLMFRRLLENTGFRNQFVNRFADLLNSNFREDRVNSAIDMKQNLIYDEIGNHLTRWKGPSFDEWLFNVQQMKSFASARPANVFSHIRQKFKFKDSQAVIASADSTQGSIQLNSLKLTSFPWWGYYFPDVPITLTALPKAGYRFVKWTGIATGSNSATITVIPQANLDLTAVFEADGSHYDDIVINEISFNNDATVNPGDWIELYNKGSYDIDVSGWKLTDSDPNHQFIFAANTWIKAGEYLVVASDLVKFKAVFGTVKYLHEPFAFNFGLGNTVDAVKLYSRDSQLIDEVNYSNSDPWQTYSLDELWSLELDNPGNDNDSGLNWVLSEKYGTPGAHNRLFIPVNISNLPVAETTTELLQNYPNPFSEGTNIKFKLDKPAKYQVTILDVNGRVLRILSSDDLISSGYSIYWDGNDNSGKPVASGVYFYRFETKGFSEIKRMVKM
jgi:uncharacterized repeat protein (TIGR02543 family)